MYLIQVYDKNGDPAGLFDVQAEITEDKITEIMNEAIDTENDGINESFLNEHRIYRVFIEQEIYI